MKYASLQQLFLHKKILPLQTVQSCYRKLCIVVTEIKLCIVVTEIGALLLPKSEHSRLPKSVHLSLPFTTREWLEDVIRRIPEYENGRSDVTHLLPKN